VRLYTRELCSQQGIVLHHVRFTALQGYFHTNLEQLDRAWDERMYRLRGLGLTRELLLDLFFEKWVQLEVIVVVRK
jgi:transcription initiation factor TFIID subunit TAF12